MNSVHPVAITGIGGIFPGAFNLKAFWENIYDGRSADGEVPEERWSIARKDAYSPEKIPDRTYSTRGCFIDPFSISELIDIEKYGLNQEFIEKLDPLYHVLLVAGIKAFEDLKNREINFERTGLVIGNIALPTEGSSSLSWEILGRTFEEKVLGSLQTPPSKETHPINRYVTGMPAGILARALGIKGGCYTLDAACASSLYAVKLAADELISGRADVMFTGGVSRSDCLYTQMGFSQLGAISPDGICSPFDSKANGLVMGEGAGIIVMKRLEDALKDGDHIYATIRGIGLSNDRAGNLLAPDTEGQIRSMKEAYSKSGWSPTDVDLVECHGTGTPVGDVVEFNSLKNLWKELEWTPGQCVIGSVKSNVGHLLTGAGAAGLIKVLMAMKEKTLPPVAHYESPNPNISTDDAPFRILHKAEPWNKRNEETPRRAAVSAFGFGGINAHVLLEEWEEKEELKKKYLDIKHSPDNKCDIAVVGMETQVGKWKNLEDFRKRVFEEEPHTKPEPKKLWFGVNESEWLNREFPNGVNYRGYGIDEIEASIGEFKIPPKELEQMLPQQLLMLKTASKALERSKNKDRDHLRSGTFVGIGFDFNTTNFHARWIIHKKVREWAEKLNLNLNEKELDQWKQELQDALSPELNANRVMGALGSIVASRISREFKFGGPSFSVSSEESSAFRSLEIALRLLQQKEIDLALVGAVDLAADIRALITAQRLRDIQNPDKKADLPLFGEGAAAMVLKRLEDAEKDGDKIYAVIKGFGSASGGGIQDLLPCNDTYGKALEKAYDEAGIEPGKIGYIEINDSGFSCEDKMEAETINRFFASEHRETPCSIGSTKEVTGDTGAASGMVSLVKTCLCLNHRMLPKFFHKEKKEFEILKDKDKFYIPRYTQYWLRNRVEGARTAGVTSFSVDGNCAHVVLEAYEKDESSEKTTIPVMQPKEAIFVVDGDDTGALIAGIQKLHGFIGENINSSIYETGKKWFGENPPQKDKNRAVTFVANDHEDLIKQLALTLKSLSEDPEKNFDKNGNRFTTGFDADSVFYSPEPLSKQGKIAFVYPGSGNHFPGMGREIGMHWPSVLLKQDRENEYLRRQIIPQEFWNRESTSHLNENHQVIIGGQVILGTLVSDLMRNFGINPSASIGYSLGESSALFGLRVWTDRDLMLNRMLTSTLYASDLAAPYNAARKAWNLSEEENVDWYIALLNIPAKRVKEAIEGREKVYLLIINTPEECIIGGEKEQVMKLIDDLKSDHLPLPGVTVAHCEVVKQVEKRYRDFHLFNVTPQEGIEFYSCGWEKTYNVTTDSAADAILNQCVHTLEFPNVINLAYNNGIRMFIEIGPGNSSSRMIKRILGEKPHFAGSACFQGKGEISQVLRVLAKLIAERVPVNLEYFYGKSTDETLETKTKKRFTMTVKFTVGGKTFEISLPQRKEEMQQPQQVQPKKIPAPENIQPVREASFQAPATVKSMNAGNLSTGSAPPVQTIPKTGMDSPVLSPMESMMKQFEEAQKAAAKAHEAYLRFSGNLTGALAQNLSHQMSLLGGQEARAVNLADIQSITPSYGQTSPGSNGDTHKPTEVISQVQETVTPTEPAVIPVMETQVTPEPCNAVKEMIPQAKEETFQVSIQHEREWNREIPDQPPRYLDREQCTEFAIGKIGNVMGKLYAHIDSYPTRVRLPDEPLMLVDRITKIEGEPNSLTHGRVVTEHDIHEGAWYLDGGKIPTCIAVEAGQADLFLSGFLGIDSITKGLAVYRLLDATVTFHSELPRPGSTIKYDIRILKFFKQGNTYLFKFEYDSTVDGKTFLTMRNGCAGFFTDEELAAGQGIIHTSLDLMPMTGVKPDDWEYFVPMEVESYSDEQIDALRRGDFEACFGPRFNNMPYKKPLTLPGGKMKLVDRILHLDPQGGRFGLGLIRAEADIHPDDWFLTCHFCDDNVMPGTLMYECCMHTMRVLLMRMGWIAEDDGNHAWDPIPGVKGSLKCRGQVIHTTKKAAYEISLKELGYDKKTGEPYAIADALMFADGRKVVEMIDMSMKLTGANWKELRELWRERREKGSLSPVMFNEKLAPIFDNDKILAFAVGKPSEAFGDKYKVFDEERIIARLPGPPYKFLDRITTINAPQWVMKPGGTILSQYDVPFDEWYFESNRQDVIPFAILLEIALQPCGWLAAYMGSALQSNIDTSFRNLGGSAVMYKPVKRNGGVLSVAVKSTNISSSGGMIIQNYEFEVFQGEETVYKGDTYFGFFSKEALANQVGVRNPEIYKPSKEEIEKGRKFDFPVEYPFSDERLQMIDEVELFVPDGGPQGLGFIRGSMNVDTSKWYFKAHFYQDPVIPGSLGLESMLQLMKVAAVERWGLETERILLTTAPGMQHNWVYRGQVIPKNKKVTVDAWITSVDDQNGILVADGFLSVDGLTIYQMNDFSLRMWSDR